MKYRNTKSGAVIDFKSKIIGGNWQPLEVAETTVKSTSTGKKKAVKKKCNSMQQ